jgi:redox-regulated HSP33 family molecular chaperone
MLTAKIRDGRIETDEPIPDLWEGLTVQILPLAPDEIAEDFEQRLKALHELGAAEFEDGEVEQISTALTEMDRQSRDEVARQMREGSL